MMRRIRSALSGILFILLLVGCGAGQSEEPPLPEESTELPTDTIPTVEPTNPPAATPEPRTGQAGPGEILFVREGQIYAILPDASNERRLTVFDATLVLRDLTMAPGGQYAAFTVDGQHLMVFDLVGGEVVTVDEVTQGGVSRPVWSPGGDVLYYQKIIFDPSSETMPVSEVWQAAMPPGSPAQPTGAVIEEEGVGLTPQFALGGGQVLLGEIREGIPGRVLFYDGGTMSLLAAQGGLVEFGIWDVSVDQSRALVYDLNNPDRVYIAELSRTEGLINPLPISPDDGSKFTMAQFAGDGLQVAALRSVPATEGMFEFRAEPVLLAPGADGYDMTVLGLAESMTAVALSWHGGAGLIAQGLSTDNTFTLWFLPLDGSDGQYLTTGEQPVVVGSP